MLALLVFPVFAQDAASPDTWQQPRAEILDVLHADQMPSYNVSPDGQWLLSTVSVRYPPLADRAAPMHALAGIRVDPVTGGFHAQAGALSPGLQRLTDAAPRPVPLADGVRILEVDWSADSTRFAFTTKEADHIGLWVGDTSGKVAKVDNLALVPLLDSAVQWLPDQQRLLVKARPLTRGATPAAPAIPPGPMVRASDGESASSTYEARDLLASAYDDALFSHFTTAQLMVVDAGTRKATAVGTPDVYASVSASPDGKYLLVERLKGPWSHRVAWWNFAHDVTVWTIGGAPVHTVTSQPAHEQVPIHGVPTGPRNIQWASTADATLHWVEALDGGDPMAKVPHRERVFQLAVKNPVKAKPSVLMDAVHRVNSVSYGEKGLIVVQQYERERRWRHVWTVTDKGPKTAKPWFDLSANERYENPGFPMYRTLPNGHGILEQQGDWVYFRGDGSSPTGDRPFIDRRSLKTGATERLFRSQADAYQRVLRVANADRTAFLMLGERPDAPPNVFLVTLGAKTAAAKGEATYVRTDKAVTKTPDPAPILRGVTKQIVTYTREDGVPLSFTLYLPPGYKAGERLPTVVYAYPREFSDAGTAGQVSGSEQTFNRIGGPSHLFYALDGYAVLHNTTMPVIGDPDTAYDTFVEQLVSSAAAAIDKAVEMGVTDRDRVGVTGHSHGGLMTVTLLAHSDLFRAGIARSGAYNHTIRPFGFQSERRTLWQAKETYLHLSPVMHADKINEPLMLIHGAVDENPGTVPLQSERLFEAVRGVGGTARLVMLPHEGHGYQSKESVEHVLWEQLSWFDKYVKQPSATTAGASRPAAPEGKP